MLRIAETPITPENWTDVIKPADMSVDALQNLLGDTNELRKWLEKMESYLKEALLGKHRAEETEWEYVTPEPSHFTDLLPHYKYHVVRTERSRTSLDQEKIKADFESEDEYVAWREAHSSTTTYYETRIKKVVPE